jgi:hypothetical protein
MRVTFWHGSQFYFKVINLNSTDIRRISNQLDAQRYSFTAGVVRLYMIRANAPIFRSNSLCKAATMVFCKYKETEIFEVLCGGVCTILPVYDLGLTCVLAGGRWGYFLCTYRTPLSLLCIDYCS